MEQAQIGSSMTSLNSDNNGNTVNVGVDDVTQYSDNDQGPFENDQIPLHTPEATNMLSAHSQVLTNPDLLQSILSFFYIPLNGTDIPPRIPAPDSQHLLWASLTCSTFFYPAMNVLWRSMDSWLPLLRLIPSLKRNGNIYTTDRVILQQDLQRLQLYGQRIRRLDLRPLTHLVSPYIYTYMSQLCQSHIFPILKELIVPNIEEIATENLPGLFLTPSSSLSELSIGGVAPFTEGIVASLLQSVYIKAPKLRELALAGQFTTSSLSLVNQFSKLETLRIDGRSTVFPGDTLQRFSELTSLKSLFVGLDNQSIIPSTSIIPSFEQLQNLDISASASHVLVILQNVAAQHLTRIQLHFTALGQGASQEILGQCIQSVGQLTTATQSLRAILTTSADESVRIPGAALACLNKQTQITHIDMAVGLITQEILRQLVPRDGWHSIETLILRSGMMARSLSTIGWLRLLSLFPNLKHLAFSTSLPLTIMHRSLVAYMETAVQHQTQCHNVEVLELLPFKDSIGYLGTTAKATVEDAFRLSRYINHMCPHLRKLDLSRMTDVDSDWREGVEFMVKGLQEVGNKGHACRVKG